jgi:multicomponent Na+:H+ antiporter subunit G
MSWVVLVLIALGSILMVLAGLGILRMPDLFTRMHASTKGASLGVALLLAAAAIHFGALPVVTKAIITTAFIFITAPVAAHVLGRAAYARRIPLWKHSVIDEARGHIGGGGGRQFNAPEHPSPPRQDDPESGPQA